MEAAHAGASEIRSTAKGRLLDPRDKANNQGLVTNADYASESAIIQLITACRQDDAILAEESGEIAGTSGVRWVIDPLDGTTNFVHGRDHSLGTAEKGQAVLSGLVGSFAGYLSALKASTIESESATCRSATCHS